MSRQSDAQVHISKLDYTLRELTRKVQEHEKELEKASRDASWGNCLSSD